MPVLVRNEFYHMLRSGHNIWNDQRISIEDSASEISIRLLLDQYPTKNAFSDGIRELVENMSNYTDKQVDFRERKKEVTTVWLLHQKTYKTAFNFLLALIYSGDLYSVVDIVTRDRLNDPGIESWWGARFSAPVQTGLSATQPHVLQVPCLFPGCKAYRARRWLSKHQLPPRLKKE